jgi:hypothetical protein
MPRNNTQVPWLTSAARTTTQTLTPDAVNYNARGLHVVLDVTSAGTGSITLTIQGKDANGIYYTLLAGAAVTTNSTNVYRVGPGLTAAANAVANDFVPLTFRLLLTANNANSMTYSASYALVG